MVRDVCFHLDRTFIKIGSMCEKIEEDKLFQQEIKLLRQQEIEMMSREADAFFS